MDKPNTMWIPAKVLTEGMPEGSWAVDLTRAAKTGEPYWDATKRAWRIAPDNGAWPWGVLVPAAPDGLDEETRRLADATADRDCARYADPATAEAIRRAYCYERDRGKVLESELEAQAAANTALAAELSAEVEVRWVAEGAARRERDVAKADNVVLRHERDEARQERDAAKVENARLRKEVREANEEYENICLALPSLPGDDAATKVRLLATQNAELRRERNEALASVADAEGAINALRHLDLSGLQEAMEKLPEGHRIVFCQDSEWGDVCWASATRRWVKAAIGWYSMLARPIAPPEPELKPCPWAGNGEEHTVRCRVEADGNRGWNARIACTCGRFDIAAVYQPSAQEAREAVTERWNRREK